MNVSLPHASVQVSIATILTVSSSRIHPAGMPHNAIPDAAVFTTTGNDSCEAEVTCSSLAL